MDMVDEWAVGRLAAADAWAFLHRHQLGRLAYHLRGEVSIVPVNYAVDGERLLFRTAPGSKLLGVVLYRDVAFEVDEVGQDGATSVVVRGRAVHLSDRDAARTDSAAARSWVPTPKEELVAIEVTEITGRSFVLDREPAWGL